MFFSFDGIDGVGKSTQLRLFCEWLASEGREPVVCRDPGSTPLGEQVRRILLASHDDTPIGPRSEMLLYMAARAQLVDEVIRPALAAGRTVVSDRFLLANIVYQGYAGGLDIATVRQVGAAAVAGVTPNCTFILDMDPAEALARVGRQLDRVESRGANYRERLRAGFLAEAGEMGSSVHVVDAAHSVDAVQTELRQIARDARVTVSVMSDGKGGACDLLPSRPIRLQICRNSARRGTRKAWPSAAGAFVRASRRAPMRTYVDRTFKTH